MDPILLINLIESAFAILTQFGEALKASGVLSADHPIHQQTAELGQKIADAKAAANQPTL